MQTLTSSLSTNQSISRDSSENSASLVDAAAVAAHLGVTRAYVYEHAVELGAMRLGKGPNGCAST